MMAWDADQWIAWLRRKRNDPAPDFRALNDCADALSAEIARLRAAVLPPEN